MSTDIGVESAGRSARRGWFAVGWVRAVFEGVCAACAGVAIQWAGSWLAGSWIPALGLVTGVLTGLGVRHGSGARGGWAYQALAVLLSYAAMCGAHLILFDPADLREMRSAGSIAALSLFVLSLPFLAGMSSLFDRAMVLLGLIQAAYWNRKRRAGRG